MFNNQEIIIYFFVNRFLGQLLRSSTNYGVLKLTYDKTKKLLYLSPIPLSSRMFSIMFLSSMLIDEVRFLSMSCIRLAFCRESHLSLM